MTKPEEQEFRPPQGGHGGGGHGGPGHGGPGHGGPGFGGPGHHGFPGHGGFPHFGHGGVNNLLPLVVAPYLYAKQPYYPYPYPPTPYSPYPYPQSPTTRLINPIIQGFKRNSLQHLNKAEKLSCPESFSVFCYFLLKMVS